MNLSKYIFPQKALMVIPGLKIVVKKVKKWVRSIRKLSCKCWPISHQVDTKLIKSFKETIGFEELIVSLDDSINNRELINKKYKQHFLDAMKIAKRYKNDDCMEKIYEKSLIGLRADEYPEILIKGSTRLKISLREASSFRVSLTMRSRRKQLGNYGPEWKLNNKIKAYRFIDALGVRRPWSYKQTFNYEALPKQDGIVIKPLSEAGARGVFCVFNQNKILNLKEATYLASWEEMQMNMNNYLNNKKVRQDKWIAEELITGTDLDYSIPRDLKFYCFYGRIKLVVEICRYPNRRYCFWDNNGFIVGTGKNQDSLFIGNGFTGEQLELAKWISSEIPAPFMRIDFLLGKDELVFGEFAPRPGKYESFNKEFDQVLGDAFLEAEGRLMNDLLNKKRFEVFNKYLQEI